MAKKQEDTLAYSSFFWSLGTTSFRTKEFNYSIERLLELLDEFWKIPQNKDFGWEIINADAGQKDVYEIKNRFYYFMRDNGFTVGEDATPYKAAREKTSGLVDLGLIDSERRMTEVGKQIFDMSKNHDYTKDNPLGISKDSYIYMKQLLKTNSKNMDVRPFVVLINLLTNLDYLTKDEFTYLAPLCISADVTDEMINNIKQVRSGEKTVDDLIVDVLMERPNYQTAYQVFMTSDISEELMMKVGINRKSRNYDKPYYLLYLLLKDVFLENRFEKAEQVYIQTTNISNVGGQWRKLLFDTSSKAAIRRAPQEHINETAFSHVSTENELREVFFRTLHLIKAKATLYDYYDLNRRYLGLSNVLIFEDGTVKLDIVPKQYFKLANAELYSIAFSEATNLADNCAIEAICPALLFNEKAVVESLNKELGLHLTSIDEAYEEAENHRYERFDKMISTKFSDETLLKLLSDFDKRNDSEITQIVTDNADVPTIFEYILAIIWYKISNCQGKILDYMKLSLDANLLPITHAAGGEADIVYEYSATKDYPAHTLLLEATLADSTNQRRMEMEPVSRHLGNYILRTSNKQSYTLFATNYLDNNVISDFRMRKVVPFYDTRDNSRYVVGMKIIPLQTSDLRSIIITKKHYTDLYPKYEKAYQRDLGMMPVYWYETCVKEKSEISSFLQAPELSEYADNMMKSFQGISILKLQQACIEKFGETYYNMKLSDWYHVTRDYVERQTMRHDIRDDEPVRWQMAAESNVV